MGNWVRIALGAMIALSLVGAWGTCHSQPDVNANLAQTARTAVDMAHEAQQDSDAAYVWPGRLRLVAVAVGTGMPITVAIVLYYLANGNALKASTNGLDKVTK